MKKGNYRLAIESLDDVIERIQTNVYLKSVRIDLSCYNGGITNISITSSEPALCSYSPGGARETNDPNLVRVIFFEILNEIAQGKFSGEMSFIILCCDGRIYNTRKQQQFNDLFGCAKSRVVEEI